MLKSQKHTTGQNTQARETETETETKQDACSGEARCMASHILKPTPGPKPGQAEHAALRPTTAPGRSIATLASGMLVSLLEG